VAPNVSPREFFDVPRVSATVRVFYFRYCRPLLFHSAYANALEAHSSEGNGAAERIDFTERDGQRGLPSKSLSLIKGTTSRADLQLAK